MMKKVLYGVALTLFAGVSVGSLQSCKDDVNDLRTQTSYDLSTLRSQLADEVARLEGRIDQKLDASTYYSDIAQYAKTTEVQGMLADLEGRINDKINGLGGASAEDISRLDGAISTLGGTVDQLAQTVAENKSYLEGKIDANKAAIDALTQHADKVDTTLQQLWDEFDQCYKQIEGVNETLSQVYNIVKDLESQLNQTIAAMDNLVTGILIQSVNSPVFGDFSLPIGIKSNVLFNWYGYNNTRAFDFPTNNKAFSATGDVNATFACETLNIPEGTYPAEVNLGKLYLTLNPVGNYYDETKPLKLQNSLGEDLPFEIYLKESDQLLTHGYSRSTEIGNKVYEGDVILKTDDEANIDAVAIRIDENLKTTMKDAIKDPSKRTAAALVKALYDQMSGMLPAYAVRYGWDISSGDTETSPKSYAVLSQYDLAAATARPLSYKFLADYHGSAKLPNIDRIENFILNLKDEIKFEIKPIVIKGATITIPALGLEPNVTVNGAGFTIHIPAIDVNVGGAKGTTVPKDVNVSSTDLKDVYKAIEDGIKDALKDVTDELDDWTADMQKDINDQLNDVLSDVQTQINDMINSINGQIDDMIDNIADKFQPFFNKANRAFEIYNNIAGKINKILEDPNAYLQVTALYKMNGGYGFVSGSVNNPTVFNKAGGNAFSVYLTSYTGELIVPAYKKFVAVTGVYKNGQKLSDSVAALNTGDLNKVLSGDQIAVGVNASGFEAGKVYEFTYQAVDYCGYTSTKKFYIEVK